MRLPGHGLMATFVLVISLSVAGCTSGSTAPAPEPNSLAPRQITPGPPPPPGATGAPVVGVTSLAPVPVGEPAQFGGGLVAKVLKIDPVQVEARGPGEIAGPGAAVTVELKNESNDPIDLNGIAVNAYQDDRVPVGSSNSTPAAAVTGSLAAGDTKQGVYVFQVPPETAGSLLVEINFSGSENVVLVQR